MLRAYAARLRATARAACGCAEEATDACAALTPAVGGTSGSRRGSGGAPAPALVEACRGLEGAIARARLGGGDSDAGGGGGGGSTSVEDLIASDAVVRALRARVGRVCLT